MTTNNETAVYLVDDDDAVRDSLKTLLESYGLEVRDFSSGREFLANAAVAEAACLILDLHLPVVSGLDLLTMMRQQRMSLPVVLITGRSDKETRERALRAGAVAFLEKPVREDALIAAIDAALAKRRPAIASVAGRADLSAALERQAP